ncbi:MAG: DNA/RNA nuclease SfsA [Armatimonadota bacterium]
MDLPHPLIPATFIERPNRFLAIVRIGRRRRRAHMPNPGRMYELLRPGVQMFVARKTAAHRTTDYDVLLVKHRGRLVSLDSRAPNAIAREAIEEGRIPALRSYDVARTEAFFGDSRLDLVLARRGRRRGKKNTMLVEVKSVTLVEKGHAMFPDAVTARGARHVRELARLRRAGYRAGVLFVIQRSDPVSFAPHDEADPEFGVALREAAKAGVNVWAHKCRLTRRSIRLANGVPVKL